jgi:NADH-dependent peroxiredoxin subunit F
LPSDPNITYDLAIIGGGPAGVAAGIYASRKRLKTIFITENFEGQSHVSEDVQNWVGTISITGRDLTNNLKSHLMAYASDVVEIKEGKKAEEIKLIQNGKTFFDTKVGENYYRSKTVLLTTGSFRRKIEVPGSKEFENKGIVYCASCDGPLFAGLDVVVIGGGNAAFETAAQLLAYCKSVTLLNRSDEFRADPVTVSKVTLNPKMHALRNVILQEVRGDKFVSSIVYKNTETNDTVELPTKGVFVEIGLLPNSYLVKDMVKVNGYGQVVVDHQTKRTSLTGIWAAGDVTDSLYHQNNIAAGDGVRALEDIYTYIHTK